LLKWCDTAQGAVWKALPDKTISNEMHGLWDSSAVMRVTTGHVSTSAENLNETDEVHISAWLSRIGTSSWDISFVIETESGGAHVASLHTTMVNVDPESMSQTMPVPHREALAAAVLPRVEISWEPVDSERHPGAFLWDTTVRLTDCDSNGHINNAIYASLAEEARGMAANSSAYSGNGNILATQLATHLFVDYKVAICMLQLFCVVVIRCAVHTPFASGTGRGIRAIASGDVVRGR
jgi:acyl-CoA thioesterase FadM